MFLLKKFINQLIRNQFTRWTSARQTLSSRPWERLKVHPYAEVKTIIDMIAEGGTSSIIVCLMITKETITMQFINSLLCLNFKKQLIMTYMLGIKKRTKEILVKLLFLLFDSIKNERINFLFMNWRFSLVQEKFLRIRFCIISWINFLFCDFFTLMFDETWSLPGLMLKSHLYFSFLSVYTSTWWLLLWLTYLRSTTPSSML